MINIEWTESSARDFKKLDSAVAGRISKKLNWISKHFDQIIPQPLSAEYKGCYKLRVGDWRIIYTLESKNLVVRFIGHRREVYKSQ